MLCGNFSHINELLSICFYKVNKAARGMSGCEMTDLIGPLRHSNCAFC
jgi:hypothetical protein